MSGPPDQIPPYRGRTVTQWAMELGIDRSGMRYRVTTHGWEKAVEMGGKIPAGTAPRKDARVYQGKTALEWARELGINHATLNSRVSRHGWEQAVAMGHAPPRVNRHASGKKARRLEYRGEALTLPGGHVVRHGDTHTLDEWAALSGICRGTIKDRMERHMTPDYLWAQTLAPPRPAKVPYCSGAPKPSRRPTTMQILECRMKNPQNRCVPCVRRITCYGE